MSLRYSKEMPGAEQTPALGDLSSFADVGWDIRISMGDEPVDEAFFISIEALSEIDISVASLLEKYALNPERHGLLDLDHFPELPFLQQELIQFSEAAKLGQFERQVFVNHREGPIDLNAPARDFLARCAFLDHSWDYLVLDLVFEAKMPESGSEELEAFCGRNNALGPREEWIGEVQERAALYEKYASVSVAPAALGIPDGFDVRFQMMELDGLSLERCILLGIWNEFPELSLEEAGEMVFEALAFKTNFTIEILNELKRL